MLDLDFRRPVSIDNAPRSSCCEQCGKPAVYQLTALGGMYHNDAGYFCRACAAEFARAVADSLDREITADVPESLLS